MLKKIGKFREYVKGAKSKKLIVLFTILLVLEIISGGFLIYFLSLLGGIETIVRYIVMILLVFIMIMFISGYMSSLMKQKKKIRSRILYFLLSLIFIVGQVFASYVIYKIYNPISSINKSSITYTTDLITLTSNEDIEDVDDIKDMKLGYISKETAEEDNKIATDMIDENKLEDDNDIKEYDEYLEMLNDLYDEEIDAIFITDNYPTMFSSVEKFANIKDETKIILEKEETFKKKNNNKVSSKNIVKEPFTVLLMGVDSEKDGLDKNAAVNGDSLMVITFNPNTLNATVLSIPRDTYVPIACFKNKKKNKITHAAWQGVDCMSQTIEDFTGIDIDYYVKMNFKGVVGLVDKLGGIEVDVPISFCEQDSNRAWGENEICLDKGVQTLNGEQALALARHRKTLSRGDIDRGLNQQLVIEGMLKKLSTIDSIEDVNGILDSISKNMDTNISTDQILSFYNVGKDVLLKSAHTTTDDLISMEQLFISGYSKMIYDPDFALTLYNYVPYETSIDAISNAMKENLGLKDAEMIKTFDFSINEEYEKKIIGADMSDNISQVEESTSNSLPNFVGKTKSYAESVLKSYNFKYTFEAVKEGDPLYKDSYSDGEIISQSVKAGTDPSKVKNLVLKYIVKDEEDDNEDACPKGTENSKCYLPNLIGETKSSVEEWSRSLPVSIKITYKDLDVDDPVYDDTLTGTFGKMSHEEGTNLSNITNLILYYKNTDTTSKTYTVTYMLDGTITHEVTYEEGDVLEEYTPTCASGTTFSGWDISAGITINKNLTINGTCKKNEQEITPPDEGDGDTEPSTPSDGTNNNE